MIFFFGFFVTIDALYYIFLRILFVQDTAKHSVASSGF
jgi:hypothetical protein